jgi:hypothetical protein
MAEQLVPLTVPGEVRYQLKNPYRDGTTHVIFEPLDVIAKLAALVPRPRVNLTRFYGVFASIVLLIRRSPFRSGGYRSFAKLR